MGSFGKENWYSVENDVGLSIFPHEFSLSQLYVLEKGCKPCTSLLMCGLRPDMKQISRKGGSPMIFLDRASKFD